MMHVHEGMRYKCGICGQEVVSIRTHMRWVQSPRMGGEHWTVNYTDTQSFINKLSYSLTYKFCVLLLNFDWLVKILERRLSALEHIWSKFNHPRWERTVNYICTQSYFIRRLTNFSYFYLILIVWFQTLKQQLWSAE